MNSRSELQIETNHVSAGTRIEVVVYTSVAGVAEFGVETVILRDDEGILHEEVGASGDAFKFACFEEVAEAVAQGDVVAAEEGGVANEVVAHGVVALSAPTEFELFHGTVGPFVLHGHAAEADVGAVAEEVIVGVVVQTGAEREAEVPVLVDELGGEAHENVGRGFLIDVAIIGVDVAVAVAIDEHVFDGVTVLVIDLLIDIEGVGRIAHLVDLNRTAGGEFGGRDTGGDAAGTVVEFRNLVSVPHHVVGHFPVEVAGLDGTGVEGELDTIVVETADVLVDAVVEVRSGFNIHFREEVFGVTEVVIH